METGLFLGMFLYSQIPYKAATTRESNKKTFVKQQKKREEKL